MRVGQWLLLNHRPVSTGHLTGGYRPAVYKGHLRDCKVNADAAKMPIAIF